MVHSQIYDALIVGGGPAGLSVAAALARQLHTTVIFDNKSYRNAKTIHMHNVPTWDHKDPADFRSAALHDALNNYQTNQYASVEVKEARQSEDGLFELTDASNTVWRGRKLVLATGVEDIFPDIEGYADCWAEGVFHCLFCHGYEERNKPSSGILAVGSNAPPPHALNMARMAAQITPEVTIYTNGDDVLAKDVRELVRDNHQFKVESRSIKKLVKGTRDAEVTVVLEDGTQKTEAFLGHHSQTRVKGSFMSQLGVEYTPSGEIKVNPPFQQTSIKGLFAAGDCATPFKAVANAIASGSMVGGGIAMQIQAEKYGHAALF